MKENRKHFLILTVLILAVALVLASCSKKDEREENLWDLGNGVTAFFEDDQNHGFVLRIQGSSAMPDFKDPSDAPWYSRSGRISSVEISKGITAVGANSFPAVSHVGQVLLPSSVKNVGKNAFAKDVSLFGYSGLADESGSRLYTYSEKQPLEDGLWWHLENDRAVIWETLRVLFIGNSFTYYNDIDSLFVKVAQGAGRTVRADRIAIGAHNLTQFSDPKDEGGKVVHQYLSENTYDFVVLQEQSTRPITGFTFFHDAAVSLNSIISERQKSAKVFLYSTWGFPKSQGSMTIPEMEGRIRDAYKKVASEIKASVSPVGQAFSEVYLNHSEINLIADDLQHPSYSGSFLSACVHAAAILGIDPRTSTFDGDLPSETARLLKQVAYETVFVLNK